MWTTARTHYHAHFQPDDRHHSEKARQRSRPDDRGGRGIFEFQRQGNGVVNFWFFVCEYSLTGSVCFVSFIWSVWPRNFATPSKPRLHRVGTDQPGAYIHCTTPTLDARHSDRVLELGPAQATGQEDRSVASLRSNGGAQRARPFETILKLFGKHQPPGTCSRLSVPEQEYFLI